MLEISSFRLIIVYWKHITGADFPVVTSTWILFWSFLLPVLEYEKIGFPLPSVCHLCRVLYVVEINRVDCKMLPKIYLFIPANNLMMFAQNLNFIHQSTPVLVVYEADSVELLKGWLNQENLVFSLIAKC